LSGEIGALLTAAEVDTVCKARRERARHSGMLPWRQIDFAFELGLTRGLSWWDNPTMILTLDAKRRLTVPATLAPATPGDAFEARFDPEENEIVFRRIAGTGDWLAVMSECPVSMDDLPRRRRQPARRRRL
jgi:hypothetical protein